MCEKCDKHKKTKEQKTGTTTKSFYSIINMLKWLESFPEDHKKSYTVEYNDNFILVFSGTVEIPAPVKKKTWKKLEEKEYNVGEKRFRVSVEEFSDE
jgi:hypothetical protein